MLILESVGQGRRLGRQARRQSWAMEGNNTSQEVALPRREGSIGGVGIL